MTICIIQECRDTENCLELPPNKKGSMTEKKERIEEPNKLQTAKGRLEESNSNLNNANIMFIRGEDLMPLLGI